MNQIPFVDEELIFPPVFESDTNELHDRLLRENAIAFLHGDKDAVRPAWGHELPELLKKDNENEPEHL